MLFLLGVFGLLLHGPLLASLRETPLTLDTFFKVDSKSAHGNLRHGVMEQESLSENDADERRLLNTVISPEVQGETRPQDELEMKALSEAIAALVVMVVQTIVLIEAIAQIVFLLIYNSAVTQKRPPPSAIEPAQDCENETDFPISICGCFEDMHYCLHGTFCRPFRIADTYHAAGLRSFWECITVWLIVTYVIPMMLFSAMLVVVPFILGVLAWHRAQLRGKLGRSPEVSLDDFILWCFCSCCAAIQEARAIDMASQTRVECCCKFVTDVDDRMPLVGAAVDARTLQVTHPASHHAVQPGPGQVRGVEMYAQPVVPAYYHQQEAAQPLVPGAMAAPVQGLPVVLDSTPAVPGAAPVAAPSAPPAKDGTERSEGAPSPAPSCVVQGVVVAVSDPPQAAVEPQGGEGEDVGEASTPAPAPSAPGSGELESSEGPAEQGVDAPGQQQEEQQQEEQQEHQQAVDDAAQEEVSPVPAKAGTGEAEADPQQPLVPEPEELRTGGSQDDGAPSS